MFFTTVARQEIDNPHRTTNRNKLRWQGGARTTACGDWEVKSGAAARVSGLPGQAVRGRLRWHQRQEAGLQGLQIVVAGEVHDEIKRHRFSRSQVQMDHHTLGAIERGGHAPGRITGRVVAVVCATRTKRTHDTGQPFGPIAGAKGLSLSGDPEDEELFGVGRDHDAGLTPKLYLI